jgi:hypothetical protein
MPRAQAHTHVNTLVNEQGRVRLLVGQDELRKLLLSVCIARIAKNNIQEQMRYTPHSRHPMLIALTPTPTPC